MSDNDDYETSFSGEQVLEGSEGTVKFNSWWLLKQLLVHLHAHMNHTCVHRKFGTLFYRKGGNLLLVLSYRVKPVHP